VDVYIDLDSSLTSLPGLATHSTMAEAASSAIGIISFGLTACKGLYEYYHAYRSFDSSISSAFESIAQVASTLVLLKDSFHDPGLDRERRDKVEACVSDCEGVLTRLNEKLQDLKTNDPKGFRGKAKAQFQRHAFPFKEQSLKELRNSADEAQSRLAFALQILELTERLKSQRVLDHLATWSNGVSVTIDEISDNTKELLSFARSEEIDKIKNWLSPPDPWTNHNAARCLHQAETGKWVLENDAYKAWLGGSSRNLWLHGKAGCGKTILSSTMVENVLHHCRQAVNFGCAPFYFTFSDKEKQTYEALLRSLLHQLGNQEPGLAIIRKKYGQRHDLRGGLSIEILQSWLLDVLAVYDTTFVVLDALDECPEDSGYLSERSKLFDGLEYLSKEAANLKINLKILMTSRDVPDIRHRVVDLPAEQLPIHAPAVDSDISRYVAEQLSKVTYFKNLQPKSRHEIQSTITAKADGM
jgi:Cdc6-like AAA superfamily ATPase